MSVDEELLAACIEEYRSRRADGEEVEPDAYRERLNDGYDEFLELVATESLFDEALEVPSEFELPRTFGAYTLLRELGRGSVGIVYESWDDRRAAAVAVKVLRSGFASDESTRRRFLREARACRQIEHRNIVDIIEAGEVEGRPYYAMSLVRGPTLSELIRSDDRPDPKTLCAGLAEVSTALALLHRSGIVHRDVKPSNIIVDGDGRMVLTDFGLVRLDTSQSLTRTGSTLGTPLYMSPEQMMSKSNVDGRADVYALGATLYEGLTGHPPFTADDYHELMPLILTTRPLPAPKSDPNVPVAVSRIALKCLEKDPRDRYDTADDLAQDLLRFSEDRRVQGRPLGPLQRGIRWTRRHPVVAGVATLVFVALGVLLAMALAGPGRGPARLNVTVDPPFAEIFLNDGEPLYPPLVDHELEPGHYVMRCTDRDYKEKRVEFDAHAGTVFNFDISLALPYPISPERLREISKRLERYNANLQSQQPPPDDGG